MKQSVPLILALAAGLATSAHARTAGSAARGTRSLVTAVGRTPTLGKTTLAQNPEAPGAVVEAQAVPKLPEGTPVVVVGEIISPPKEILEHKMQVAIGPARIP